MSYNLEFLATLLKDHSDDCFPDGTANLLRFLINDNIQLKKEINELKGKINSIEKIDSSNEEKKSDSPKEISIRNYFKIQGYNDSLVSFTDQNLEKIKSMYHGRFDNVSKNQLKNLLLYDDKQSIMPISSNWTLVKTNNGFGIRFKDSPLKFFAHVKKLFELNCDDKIERICILDRSGNIHIWGSNNSFSSIEDHQIFDCKEILIGEKHYLQCHVINGWFVLIDYLKNEKRYSKNLDIKKVLSMDSLYPITAIDNDNCLVQYEIINQNNKMIWKHIVKTQPLSPFKKIKMNSRNSDIYLLSEKGEFSVIKKRDKNEFVIHNIEDNMNWSTFSILNTLNRICLLNDTDKKILDQDTLELITPINKRVVVLSLSPL